MTIHSSLKTKSGALSQHRNVLTRAERITKLTGQEKFTAGTQSPLGIVKVRNINVAAKKKAATKAEGEAAPAAGAKAAAPAAGGKAAAGAGAKAPAGGKAAPAAKAGGDSKKK
jgi:small basic protein (TIGR04137 family)